MSASPLLIVEPGLDPAAVVAKVRASGAASIRIGNAFNDYSPAAYKCAWREIESALRTEGLGHVRMEWAFRPTGQLVPFMDWHPGEAAHLDWALVGQLDDPSARSFLEESAKSQA